MEVTLNDYEYEECDWAEAVTRRFPAPKGRKPAMPRKKKYTKPENLNDALIKPVSNGYMVTTSSLTGDQFVFGDIDKALEFIKNGLKPTREQEAFLEKV